MKLICTLPTVMLTHLHADTYVAFVCRQMTDTALRISKLQGHLDQLREASQAERQGKGRDTSYSPSQRTFVEFRQKLPISGDP